MKVSDNGFGVSAVPGLFRAVGLLRIKPGQQVRGVVVPSVIGCVSHWVRGRSVLCPAVSGRHSCVHCDAGDSGQWRAFLPVSVEVDGERRADRLLELSARALSRAGVDRLEEVVRREIWVHRAVGRRYPVVEFGEARQLQDQLGTARALAVIFGVARFWVDDGTCDFGRLLSAAAASQAAEWRAE